MVQHILLIMIGKWYITLNLKAMKTVTLIILIFAMIFLSCQEEEVSTNIDIVIEITVIDKSGNDLLNPSVENSFKEESIKIYYLIDGVVEEVYYPNSDNPKGFRIYERDSIYRMGLSPNGNKKEEFPVTYIQWNETDTDTVKGSFLRGEGFLMCTKVWYNGVLMWEDYNTERRITVVK